MIGTFSNSGNTAIEDVRLQVRHPDISNAPTDEREQRQYELWRFIMEFDYAGGKGL